MHKCTSLAIHDDTGIAKLLFILTSNGATDRDSVHSCMIYFTVFYLYICGVILPAFMLLCIVLLYACCTLSENDEIKLINQSIIMTITMLDKYIASVVMLIVPGD